MGKEKYISELESLFSKSPVVSYASIRRIVTSKKKVRQYVKLLIHRMVLKGKIKRLTKGYYTSHNDASLAVFCFQPAYLGLQDAMSFHNIWEQETVPVIITTRKARPGLRSILGTNALIRRIEKKYFFALEYQKLGNAALPYSDLEKTFLDMLYFKENLSNNAIRAFKKRVDRKKLASYLKKYPEKLRRRAVSLLR